MKSKISFYLVAAILCATLISLSIGSQAKYDLNTLSQITLEESENNIRGQMQSLLQVAREGITQNIKLSNTNISTVDGVNLIIEENVKPLDVESSSSGVVLMQVKPDVAILYEKRHIEIPDNILELIRTGVDSDSDNNTIKTAESSNQIFEWVGIPPGVAEFNNNSKWVLIFEKDKSEIEASASNVLLLETSITYKLYTILLISCLVVITSVVYIHKLIKNKSENFKV